VLIPKKQKLCQNAEILGFVRVISWGFVDRLGVLGRRRTIHETTRNNTNKKARSPLGLFTVSASHLGDFASHHEMKKFPLTGNLGNV